MKKSTIEETYELLNQFAKREGIDLNKTVEIINNSFIEAYKGNNEIAEVEISFDSENKVFNAYQVYKISSKVQNPQLEISKNDERISKSEKIINDKAFFSIDIKNLPKFIAHKIRKNIQNSIQKLRREKQYQNFLPLKGELVSGYIQSIEENFCIVNLGRGVGYWDKKEWESNSYLGKSLRFLLIDVQEKFDLKQLVLSRRTNLFIYKLFEEEIPEIKDGIVSIKEILRIPGLISKVIVDSKNSWVDPVGSCIGRGSSRIRGMLKELPRERVDLVAWNENKKKLLFNLISPVEIISVIEESNDDWILIIPEHRMSLALYAGGKLIQKISEYLKINLHIKNFKKSQLESNIVVWNGNISLSEYEAKKDLFLSLEEREINLNFLSEKKRETNKINEN